MAYFDVGQTIPSDEPFIVVDPNLDLGEHVFELVVEDQARNQSNAVSITVTVIDTIPPEAKLETYTHDDNTGEPGDPIPDGTIQYGNRFCLNGKDSDDLGGSPIVQYYWTRIS